MQSKRIMSAIMSLILSSSFVFSNFTDGIIYLTASADADTTVNVLMNHYDTWKELALVKDGISDIYFLDVDFDGELELVVENYAGSGRYTTLEFYKVNGDTITKINVSENVDGFPDGDIKLYRDANGVMEYYGYDFLRGGAAYHENTYCSFAYYSSKNAIGRTNYFSSVYEAVYNSTTKEYDDTYWWYNFATESKISEEEYNRLEKDKIASMTDMNLTYKVVDIKNLSSTDEIKQALIDSYNSFSYDGYKVDNSDKTLTEEELKAKLEAYGTISVWEYHDYDGNGTSEAFGVITELSDSETLLKHVYFIDSNGTVTQMPEEFWSGNCYVETEKYSECEDSGFFSFDMGNSGSGWQTLLYSVKDNEPYELDVSRELQGFYQNRATGNFYTTKNDFSNGYHEYPEYDLIYDRYLQQFTIGERSKNEQVYGDYVYYVNADGEVVITQYKGTEENVTIPSEIDGKKVTTISGIEGPADLEYRRIGAFQNNENLKSVTIPDTVTIIEMYSFMSCYNLESITMSNNIKTIEQYAFCGCKFPYIYLPESIERIEIGYSSSGVIDKFVIYGFSGTVAETYANDNDILFVARNSDDTIIQPLEINLDYEKISDYTTLPDDDTVRLMGYPVYKITATVKNIDLKTANNVAVKLNSSSEMTLIDGDESQTVETINSREPLKTMRKSAVYEKFAKRERQNPYKSGN